MISEVEIETPAVESQRSVKLMRSSSAKLMRLSSVSVCLSDGLALLQEPGGTHREP